MIGFREYFTFKDPYITAASGIVQKGDRLYVVSDDELGIISLRVDLKEKATYHNVFKGTLPSDEKLRKIKKPDLECLTIFENSLLLIPSGSKPNRFQGALINLDTFNIKELSFMNVFNKLYESIKELNIEGAVIFDDNILLFQRGNGKESKNAVIKLNLNSFLKDKSEQVEIKTVNLGAIKGIPQGFTDATILKNKIHFLSVSEGSFSTYDDGEFLGASLGVMTFDGEILSSTPIDLPFKPEGLTFINDELYVVTDSDNRQIESKLYKSIDRF